MYRIIEKIGEIKGKREEKIRKIRKEKEVYF